MKAGVNEKLVPAGVPAALLRVVRLTLLNRLVLRTQVRKAMDACDPHKHEETWNVQAKRHNELTEDIVALLWLCLEHSLDVRDMIPSLNASERALIDF